MGGLIELNDTLQLTTEQGFPSELILEQHLKKPFTATDFEGKVFSFQGKPNARIFQPARILLVHNIDGRWLYWGHIEMLEQTIHADSNTTAGKFRITQIYTPEHQRSMSTYETPDGCEYQF